MRLAALILAFALALPAAGASVATPLPVAVSRALPDGCSEAKPGTQVCEWWINNTQRAGDIGAAFDLDLPARSLVTFTVVLDGADNGWLYRFGQGEGEDSRIVSQSRHVADPTAPDQHVVVSDTHLLLVDAEESHWLVFFWHANLATLGYVGAPASFAPSVGTFHIIMVVEDLPPGDAPTRPAATRDDPHIADLEGDAARPELDVRAAWLDDSGLGDGLFDAHLAVGSLDHVEFNDTLDNRLSELYTTWKLRFEVLSVAYEVWWGAYANGTSSPTPSCRLFSEGQLLMNPSCTWDLENATLHAVIPERTVGNPGAATLFTLDAAWTTHGQDLNAPPAPEDEARAQRYAFALGGPEVWSGLNPRLDPPVVASAWYEDPLASNNLPNTLQVIGAIIASITTLVGAFLLWRNRRQTRELLRRVDLLVDRTDASTRAALVALGELEREFTQLYHAGRINESQYQLATQRIVSAASRLALRKELGLDDGTPDADSTRVTVNVKRSP